MTRNTAQTAPIWLRALNWLADRDAAYRQAQKLKSLPDERLVDMGITRAEAARGGAAPKSTTTIRTRPAFARG